MTFWLILAVHWLHVFCGIWWFGSLIYSRLVVYPRLRAVGGDLEATVRKAVTSGRAGQITIAVAIGTVGLGIVRGLLDGVLERLTTLYGLTYLAALVVGVLMVVYLIGNWDSKLLNRLYVAAFPTMFTLMVLLRFGL